MLEQLQTILSEATSEISKANTLEELNNLKVSLLGKKGRLTLTAAGMKDLSDGSSAN